MSIELDIKRMADALETIALYRGELRGLSAAPTSGDSTDKPESQEPPKRRAKKKASKKKAAKRAAEPEPEPEPKVSMDDVRDELVKLERDDIKDILKQCGASKLSELPVDMYETAYNLAKEYQGGSDDDGLL